MKLSHSPLEIASGLVNAVELQPDLQVGMGSEFGIVADIAGLGRGRFAVFDMIQEDIKIFDANGTQVATLGREGDGPGEFRFPFGLEAAGDRLVAWEGRPTSTFTLLRRDGKVLATGGETIRGDWTRPLYRRPIFNVEGRQKGPEDITRRLSGLNDGEFIFQLQIDETRDGPDPHSYRAPPVWLVRYGKDARVRDTMAVLVGPPTLLKEVRPGGVLVYYQAPFAARPVWTTGDGWIALSHGDSSHVLVTALSGDTLLVLRWPRQRRPISDEDRTEAARWLLSLRAVNYSRSATIYEHWSVRQRREAVRQVIELELSPSSNLAPTVTAAYGAGDCLFLSGFAPADWIDGTALTWIAVNVRKGTLERVLHLRPAGERLPYGQFGAAVRDFGEHFAYTYVRDYSEGRFVVQRYRLPQISCGG